MKEGEHQASSNVNNLSNKNVRGSRSDNKEYEQTSIVAKTQAGNQFKNGDGAVTSVPTDRLSMAKGDNLENRDINSMKKPVVTQQKQNAQWTVIERKGHTTNQGNESTNQVCDEQLNITNKFSFLSGVNEDGMDSGSRQSREEIKESNSSNFGNLFAGESDSESIFFDSNNCFLPVTNPDTVRKLLRVSNSKENEKR